MPNLSSLDQFVALSKCLSGLPADRVADDNVYARLSDRIIERMNTLLDEMPMAATGTPRPAIDVSLEVACDSLVRWVQDTCRLCSWDEVTIEIKPNSAMPWIQPSKNVEVTVESRNAAERIQRAFVRANNKR